MTTDDLTLAKLTIAENAATELHEYFSATLVGKPWDAPWTSLDELPAATERVVAHNVIDNFAHIKLLIEQRREALGKDGTAAANVIGANDTEARLTASEKLGTLEAVARALSRELWEAFCAEQSKETKAIHSRNLDKCHRTERDITGYRERFEKVLENGGAAPKRNRSFTEIRKDGTRQEYLALER